MIRYSVLADAKLPNDESPPNHLADPCVWLRRASSLIAPLRCTSGVAGSEETKARRKKGLTAPCSSNKVKVPEDLVQVNASRAAAAARVLRCVAGAAGPY